MASRTMVQQSSRSHLYPHESKQPSFSNTDDHQAAFDRSAFPGEQQRRFFECQLSGLANRKLDTYQSPASIFCSSTPPSLHITNSSTSAILSTSCTAGGPISISGACRKQVVDENDGWALVAGMVLNSDATSDCVLGFELSLAFDQFNWCEILYNNYIKLN